MEWLSSIRTAINYMEEHLTDDISAQDVADRVHLSPFFLQRGFSLMTGYGIGEYMRNRRLYQAARDLKETEDKVIEVALRYCYDTPESFTKAFSRFHGATPSQVRDGAAGKVFLPLTIKLSVQGGSQMDVKIAPMFPFKVIGFQKILIMKLLIQKFRSSGMKPVRSMPTVFMREMHRRIPMSRRWWTTASGNMASASTISAEASSAI